MLAVADIEEGVDLRASGIRAPILVFGALSVSDDVTVTVNAAQESNDAPAVHAGADQTVTLPAGASLAGTATDDGKPAGEESEEHAGA